MTDLAVYQQFNDFSDISALQLERIREYARIETVPKGAFIHKRGKGLTAYCYLIGGRVDLVDSQFNSETIEPGSARQKSALVDESPSPVSAQAKTDVELLIVEPEALKALEEGDSYITDLEHIDTTQPGQALHLPGVDDNNDWMSSLLDAPLFTQISPAQLQQIFQRFDSIKCELDDVIVSEGEHGDYFYVIERGSVEISTRLQGVVATLSAGQYFGEEALVGDSVRNATVTLKSPGVLMRLAREDFKDLLHDPLIRYIDSSKLSSNARDGMDYQLLDVRLPVEYRTSHVSGCRSLPLSKLRERVRELDKNITYIVTDDGGKRSEVAAHLICQAGFDTFILRDAAEHYSSV